MNTQESLTSALLHPDEALDAGTPFNEVIRLWLDRRNGHAVPDWSDFDFADFCGWHAEMAISVFPDDEPDPQLRIIGEEVKAVTCCTIKGARFSELQPDLYRSFLREHFRRIRQDGLIGWSIGRVVAGGTAMIAKQMMELPVRRGGDGVDGLIHVIVHNLGYRNETLALAEAPFRRRHAVAYGTVTG